MLKLQVSPPRDEGEGGVVFNGPQLVCWSMLHSKAYSLYSSSSLKGLALKARHANSYTSYTDRLFETARIEIQPVNESLRAPSLWVGAPLGAEVKW